MTYGASALRAAGLEDSDEGRKKLALALSSTAGLEEPDPSPISISPAVHPITAAQPRAGAEEISILVIDQSGTREAVTRQLAQILKEEPFAQLSRTPRIWVVKAEDLLVGGEGRLFGQPSDVEKALVEQLDSWTQEGIQLGMVLTTASAGSHGAEIGHWVLNAVRKRDTSVPVILFAMALPTDPSWDNPDLTRLLKPNKTDGFDAVVSKMDILPGDTLQFKGLREAVSAHLLPRLTGLEEPAGPSGLIPLGQQLGVPNAHRDTSTDQLRLNFFGLPVSKPNIWSDSLGQERMIEYRNLSPKVLERLGLQQDVLIFPQGQAPTVVPAPPGGGSGGLRGSGLPVLFQVALGQGDISVRSLDPNNSSMETKSFSTGEVGVFPSDAQITVTNRSSGTPLMLVLVGRPLAGPALSDSAAPWKGAAASQPPSVTGPDRKPELPSPSRPSLEIPADLAQIFLGRAGATPFPLHLAVQTEPAVRDFLLGVNKEVAPSQVGLEEQKLDPKKVQILLAVPTPSLREEYARFLAKELGPHGIQPSQIHEIAVENLPPEKEEREGVIRQELAKLPHLALVVTVGISMNGRTTMFVGQEILDAVRSRNDVPHIPVIAFPILEEAEVSKPNLQELKRLEAPEKRRLFDFDTVLPFISERHFPDRLKVALKGHLISRLISVRPPSPALGTSSPVEGGTQQPSGLEERPIALVGSSDREGDLRIFKDSFLKGMLKPAPTLLRDELGNKIEVTTPQKLRQALAAGGLFSAVVADLSDFQSFEAIQDFVKTVNPASREKKVPLIVFLSPDNPALRRRETDLDLLEQSGQIARYYWVREPATSSLLPVILNSYLAPLLSSKSAGLEERGGPAIAGLTPVAGQPGWFEPANRAGGEFQVDVAEHPNEVLIRSETPQGPGHVTIRRAVAAPGPVLEVVEGGREGGERLLATAPLALTAPGEPVSLEEGVSYTFNPNEPPVPTVTAPVREGREVTVSVTTGGISQQPLILSIQPPVPSPNAASLPDLFPEGNSFLRETTPQRFSKVFFTPELAHLAPWVPKEGVEFRVIAGNPGQYEALREFFLAERPEAVPWIIKGWMYGGPTEAVRIARQELGGDATSVEEILPENPASLSLQVTLLLQRSRWSAPTEFDRKFEAMVEIVHKA